MDIDITGFVAEYEGRFTYFSDSVARSGLDNIGQLTWDRALAAEPLLRAGDEVEAAREYMLGFGAWMPEELTDETVQALFIQLISDPLRTLVDAANDSAADTDPDTDTDPYATVAEALHASCVDFDVDLAEEHDPFQMDEQSRITFDLNL